MCLDETWSSSRLCSCTALSFHTMPVARLLLDRAPLCPQLDHHGLSLVRRRVRSGPRWMRRPVAHQIGRRGAGSRAEEFRLALLDRAYEVTFTTVSSGMNPRNRARA